jgi:hypothetical protein
MPFWGCWHARRHENKVCVCVWRCLWWCRTANFAKSRVGHIYICTIVTVCLVVSLPKIPNGSGQPYVPCVLCFGSHSCSCLTAVSVSYQLCLPARTHQHITYDTHTITITPIHNSRTHHQARTPAVIYFSGITEFVSIYTSRVHIHTSRRTHQLPL